MTFAVERMNGVRQALDDRAGRLPASDAVTSGSAPLGGLDVMRKKIVGPKRAG